MPHPDLYGVPVDLLVDLTGVSRRQAIAFKSGRAQPAPAVLKLVRLHLDGRILGDDWLGWRSHSGALIDPEGHRTTQPQLRAYAFVYALAWDLARGNPTATRALEGYLSLGAERLKRQQKQTEGKSHDFERLEALPADVGGDVVSALGVGSVARR